MISYAESCEIFNKLDADEQKSRLRVADYTKVLYRGAIKCQMEVQNIEAKSYLKNEYIDAVYNAALHAGIEQHKQGEDQIDDFENRVFEYTKDIEPKLERKDNIDLLRILYSKAVEIENTLMNNLSEIPFNDMARDIILKIPKESEINLVVEISVTELKKVYEKYEQDIIHIKVPTAYVRRKKGRKMLLTYTSKPYLEDLSRVILTARPTFRGKGNKELDISEFHLETDAEFTKDLFSYFLYEAADMIKRLESYGIYIAYLNLLLLPNTMQQQDIYDRYAEMLADFDIDKKAIRLVVSKEDVSNKGKTYIENLKKFKENSVPIMEMDTNDKIEKSTSDATDIIKTIKEELFQFKA